MKPWNVLISSKILLEYLLAHEARAVTPSAVAPFLSRHLVRHEELLGASLLSPCLPATPGSARLLRVELHFSVKESATTEAMLSFSCFLGVCPGFVLFFVWRDLGCV